MWALKKTERILSGARYSLVWWHSPLDASGRSRYAARDMFTPSLRIADGPRPSSSKSGKAAPSFMHRKAPRTIQGVALPSRRIPASRLSCRPDGRTVSSTPTLISAWSSEHGASVSMDSSMTVFAHTAVWPGSHYSVIMDRSDGSATRAMHLRNFISSGYAAIPNSTSGRTYPSTASTRRIPTQCSGFLSLHALRKYGAASRYDAMEPPRFHVALSGRGSHTWV